jgi:ribosomal-protein-alanine N-acetyltransferase
MKAQILESERLILKPLSIVHLSEDYLSWLNDEIVYKYLETRGNYTIEMLKQFLLKIEEQDIFFWGIHLKSNGKHIGNIKIDPINAVHGLGEYGIMMGDRNEWGKGYAFEASKRVIDFCFFERMNLRKMTLGVVASNFSAVKLYVKLGFLLEGNYKNHSIYNGKYEDVLRMAIFNPNVKYD